MKKTYINPNVTVVLITTAKHMLSGSNMEMRGEYKSGTVTIGSRGNSDWDDEE